MVYIWSTEQVFNQVALRCTDLKLIPIFAEWTQGERIQLAPKILYAPDGLFTIQTRPIGTISLTTPQVQIRRRTPFLEASRGSLWRKQVMGQNNTTTVVIVIVVWIVIVAVGRTSIIMIVVESAPAKHLPDSLTDESA